MKDKRDRIITPLSLDEETIPSQTLRPKCLDEYVGQEEVKKNLFIAIQAAKQRKEPVEHILLYGPPGLGKTTLAYIVAEEMQKEIFTTSGPALERAGDLVGILSNLKEGTILFIDEIHRLNRVVEEFLYPAMEDFKLDFVIEKGPYARTIQLKLQRFTLIGATTRAGLLSAPLRERFGLFYHLDFYSVDELIEIIKRAASILSLNITPDAAREIATRSRGTPRIAVRLLKRVRDYVQVKGASQIVRELVDEALWLQGVDALGLDPLDRKYLEVIIDYYNGGAVGIEAIAATLGEEIDTLVDMVEPFLLKEGFLQRTHIGRKVTSKTYNHLKQSKRYMQKEIQN